MPAVHAPHAMTVAGKQYRGGEFIPGEAQDAATPGERAALGLPDHSPTAGQVGRLQDHAKAVLGGKYDSNRHLALTKKYVLRPGTRHAGEAHRKALEHMLGEADHGDIEPDEPDDDDDDGDESDASATQQFADGYADAGDDPADRLQHFVDSLAGIDPDDPAFGEDARDAVAADIAEADPETVANLADEVFRVAGYDPGDPRTAALMAGLAQRQPAPPAPFAPSEKDTYGLVDLDAIADEHQRAAAREMLRGLGHSAEAGGVAVVPLTRGGRNTPFYDYLHGTHFDAPDIHTDDSMSLDGDAEAAHATLFDGLAGRPMVAEPDAPAGAKNFGRVSAGGNVAIESDWNPDANDVYKPVSKGWYMVRRGTANPDLDSGAAEMYRFVPRSQVPQLVSLPPQYWEGMSAGLTKADADTDTAAGRAAREEKAAGTKELKRKRDLKAESRELDRGVGSARDLANRVRGMDERGLALETVADRMHQSKEDGELSAPDSGGDLPHPLHAAYAHARHSKGAAHPDAKAAKQAWVAAGKPTESVGGADSDHPSAPHYAALHDALDDLHGDAPGWQDIDSGFDSANDFDDAAPRRRADVSTGAAEEESERAKTNENLEGDNELVAEELADRRRALELAHDAYGDHFAAMGGHLKRVRDAAAAAMPHVADDAGRTEALKRVHALAGRHLKRLKGAGHFVPPAGYEMAWVAYRAVRKPKTVGKRVGDQVGWREDQTGEIRYVAKKPRELADRPKLAAPDLREGLQDQIKAAVESGDHAALETLLTRHTRDGLRALLKGTGRRQGGLTKAEISAALLEHARGVQSWHGFVPTGGAGEVGERIAGTDIDGDGREDIIGVPRPDETAEGPPPAKKKRAAKPKPKPAEEPTDADDVRPEGAGPGAADADGGGRVDGRDPVPVGGGDGGGGTDRIDGPIPVVLARAEHTPAPDLSYVPPDLLPHLRPVQQEGVAHAVKAMATMGGFLLADGPGTGKTRQILAVARRFLDAGKKVLVVAPSEVIKPDWKKGTLYGSFDADARAMGVPTKLASDPAHLAAGHVAITSYEKMKEFADHIGDDTVIVFDESHYLKNRDSARAKTGQAMAAKAHAVMFSTATPGDKPLHMAYLSRAGVFGTAGREATYSKLGMELHDQRVGGGVTRKIWRVKKGVGNAEARRRIGGLYDQLTREGLMVRRELDTSGLDFGTTDAPLSDGQRAELAGVERAVLAKTVGPDQPKGNGALAMMAARLHQEPMKIPATVDAIREELAAGRSPVVFVGRVNAIGGEDDSDDDEAKDALGEAGYESVGTATALKEALLKAGVPAEHIAELHGGATKTPAAKKKSMDSFQSGKAKVMIATIQSGGTGVNLDDTTGNRPRTAIIVTPPFSANDMAQAVGRVHRLNTRSRSKIRLMLTDSDVDRRNADTLRSKFGTLSAMAGGQASASEAVFGEDPANAAPPAPFAWGDALAGGIGVGAAHHFDVPAYHNDLAGRHGGRRTKKGEAWTTEFPSRSHFERYRAAAEEDRKAHEAKRAAVAAAQRPAPSPARAPTHFRGGTYASLRSGGWGVRAPAGAEVGDTVTVTTRGGKKQDVRITKVVASFGDAVLAEFSTA